MRSKIARDRFRHACEFEIDCSMPPLDLASALLDVFHLCPAQLDEPVDSCVTMLSTCRSLTKRPTISDSAKLVEAHQESSSQIIVAVSGLRLGFGAIDEPGAQLEDGART
jgi:hypothetical protein